MEYSSLYELIKYLEYGTNIHIGVLCFGNYGNEKCVLPQSHTIHSGKICDELKNSRNGYSRCFKCRNLAIQKAIDTQNKFSGYCINGIFEYTHPVIIDGEVAFIIFIGNILGDNSEKIKAKLIDKPELIHTLECGFSQRQCEAVGNVIETYIRMILKAIPQSKKNDCNQMIENIKNYVDSNLEFDIKISYVANIFHYNVQYIGRLFKKSTALTFNEYVNHQRLARSKLLLRDSDLTVLNISNRLGFNNVSYFNRLFKKHYGKTPTEYRKSADVE